MYDMPYKDPEQARKRWQAYYLANRKRILGVQRTYKNRCRGRKGSGISPEEWRALCVLYQGRCVHCGVYKGQSALTRDHLIPLSRGGIDEPRNVVPSCRACNRAHGTLLMHEWRPGSFLCTCTACVLPGQCICTVDCECLLCMPVEEEAAE